MSRPSGPVVSILAAATLLLLGATPSLADASALAASEAVAVSHLRANSAELGLTPTDLDELVVTNAYRSRHTGTTHVYVTQYHGGIEVYLAQANVTIHSDGRVVRVANRLVSRIASKARGQVARISAEDAVRSAAAALELGSPQGLAVDSELGGLDRRAVLSDAGISQAPIPARLVYHQTAGGNLRLAWDLQIQPLDGANWWSLRVDAASGLLLATDDFIDYEQYAAYPIPVESPIDAAILPPADGRVLTVNPFDPSASPFGWHDTNGAAGAEFTITRGNNVHAYADVDGNNIPDPGNPEPDGGAGLDFDAALVPLNLANAPSTYRPAAMVNLFYWNNIIHDVMWQYGFDEPAGNFQFNTYGNGGLGSDDVMAEAQNAGNCNANFGTPADGARPRMQMFVCTTPNPDRDSDLDNEVITHEYGHGISNRLTGGPSQAGCLGVLEQMGEGWSDFFGLMLTMKATATGSESRGFGNYFVGQSVNGGGIRPAPYSTNLGVNNFTYANVGSVAIPHGVGFVWATMLWDMTWNLIDAHGLNPDIYGDWTTGGNNLAMQLVMDGLKLQPCSPGFVDGRDAILAADDILTGTGAPGTGLNQCAIWDAFAGRGLGYSASQGSTNSVTDGTPASDMPPWCTGLGAPLDTAQICQGDTATFVIGAGAPFTMPPVTLAVTDGQPAGTVAAFSPNPLATVPRASTFELSSTALVPAGTYAIEVTGSDTNPTSFDTTVDLEVFAVVPGAPALATPGDGSIGQPVRPTLTWSAVANATSYTLEVDDDPGFGSVDYLAAGVLGTSHTLAEEVAYETEYHWRVRADNPCGVSPYSAVRTFETAVFPGACPAGSVPSLVFEDDLEGGAAGWTSSGPANTWALSSTRVTSGLNAFYAADLDSTSDQRLQSPSIALPSLGDGVTKLTLQFNNYQAFEAPNGDGRCWDAGVLEVSTNDGVSYAKVPQSALLTDPYDNILWNNTPGNNPISNSYGATEAWCDELQPYLASVVNLSTWAGQTVRFRWRLGSDGGAGNEGWYIDDVMVQRCDAAPIFVDGFESGSTSAWSSTVP